MSEEPEPRLGDFIVEPHEVETFMPALRLLLPEDKLATLLAEKVVEHGGRRYAIRGVMRLRPIDPEAWRRAAKERSERGLVVHEPCGMAAMRVTISARDLNARRPTAHAIGVAFRTAVMVSPECVMTLSLRHAKLIRSRRHAYGCYY